MPPQQSGWNAIGDDLEKQIRKEDPNWGKSPPPKKDQPAASGWDAVGDQLEQEVKREDPRIPSIRNIGLGDVKEFLQGAAAGPPSTAAHTADLIRRTLSYIPAYRRAIEEQSRKYAAATPEQRKTMLPGYFMEAPEIQKMTTPPPTTAGRLGFGTEQAAEFLVPVPGLSGLKAAKGAGLLSRLGWGALRTGLDVGIKTGMQTGQPEEAAESALIAGPIGGAFEITMPGVSRVLNKWAKSQYAKYLQPLGRKAKERAQEVVPEFLQQGYRAAAGFTREGLAARVSARTARLAQDISNEYQRLDATTRTNLKPIYDGFSDWVERNAFTKGGAIKDEKLLEAAFERLDYIQNTLGPYFGHAQPSEVWEIRQALDKYVYPSGKFGADESMQAAAQVRRALGNVIRDQLNKQHPSMAELNNSFHLWKSVASLMQRKITNDFGKMRFARNTGAIGLALLGEEAVRDPRKPSKLEVAIGGAGAALLGLAMESPGWRTTSAVTKTKIANFLANGNGVAAANLAARAVGLTRRATGPSVTPPPPTSPAPAPATTKGAPPRAGLTPELKKAFADAGERNGVVPSMLMAMAQTESGYDPTQESPKGAKGLMQFMPDTAKQYGVDPSDPVQSIHGAARYMKDLLARYNGDRRLALAAYNAGPAKVDLYGDVPPYEETQKYVNRVLARMDAGQ